MNKILFIGTIFRISNAKIAAKIVKIITAKELPPSPDFTTVSR
jgi:hypothetical protein